MPFRWNIYESKLIFFESCTKSSLTCVKSAMKANWLSLKALQKAAWLVLKALRKQADFRWKPYAGVAKSFTPNSVCLGFHLSKKTLPFRGPGSLSFWHPVLSIVLKQWTTDFVSLQGNQCNVLLCVVPLRAWERNLHNYGWTLSKLAITPLPPHLTKVAKSYCKHLQ